LLNLNVDQPFKYDVTWLIDEWSKIGLHVTQRVVPDGPHAANGGTPPARPGVPEDPETGAGGGDAGVESVGRPDRAGSARAREEMCGRKGLACCARPRGARRD